MNLFKKIFFIFVILSIFYAPSALAYKRAIFPDSAKLQPIPEDVAPNISGNINSELDSSLPQNLSESDSLSSGNVSNPAAKGAENKGPSPRDASDKSNFIWLAVVVIFMAIALIYAFKKNGAGKK